MADHPFIIPVTPYTRVLSFLLFKAENPAEAYAELRSRDLQYIYPTLDHLKKDYLAMVATMPEEVEGWRRFSAKSARPAPDDKVGDWCSKYGILKFYQQVTLARQTLEDGNFMGAWELFSLRGTRALAEAMKLSKIPSTRIHEKLLRLDAGQDFAVLDNYFLHFFSEHEMSKSDIYEWLRVMKNYSMENPAFVAESESKRIAVVAPGDLFLILRRLGIPTEISPEQMNTEIRQETFGRFYEARDWRVMNDLSGADFEHFERASAIMKSMADVVKDSIRTGTSSGLQTKTRERPRVIPTLSVSAASLRGRDEFVAEGMVEKKSLPSKGSNN